MTYTTLFVQKSRTLLKNAFMVLVTIISLASIPYQELNAQNLDPNITGYNLGKVIDIRPGNVYSTWIQQSNQYFWQMTNGRGKNEGNYNFSKSSQTGLLLKEGVRFDLSQKKAFYPNGEIGNIVFVGVKPNMSQSEIDQRNQILDAYKRMAAEEEREYNNAVAEEAQAAREEAQAEQEAIRSEQEAQRAEAEINNTISIAQAQRDEQQAAAEEQQAIADEQQAARNEQQAIDLERQAIQKDNELEKLKQSAGEATRVVRGRRSARRTYIRSRRARTRHHNARRKAAASRKKTAKINRRRA